MEGRVWGVRVSVLKIARVFCLFVWGFFCFLFLPRRGKCMYQEERFKGIHLVGTSAMFVLAVLVCFVYQLSDVTVAGVTMSPCGADNTAEVVKGKTDNAITCTGLTSGEEVNWYIFFNGWDTALGYCPATSSGEPCLALIDDALTPSRVSNTSSRMVINSTDPALEALFRTGTLRCSNDVSGNQDTCRLDYVVPAQGNCTVQTGTGSSRFHLEGSCNLQAGASSARNRFQCEWRRTDGGWNYTVSLTEDDYQTGCVFANLSLPVTSGLYTYTVELLPGRQISAAGSINISRPETPVISGCGGEDYVPENATVTCACTTATAGQPPGRLWWEKGGEGAVSRAGNYGDRILTVAQTLLRSDHRSTLFRCNVEWTTNVPGPAITFNVGYPPTRVTLSLNGFEDDLTVTEHQPVELRCASGDGRPDPTLRLVKSDNSVVLSGGSSALSHVTVTRCQDSGAYVCIASNGMGPPLATAPAKLLVTCSPRGRSDVGEVTFLKEPVSISFDVTAYPAPDLITFLSLGPTRNDTETSEVNDTLITLVGDCQPKPEVVHQSTCTVTVVKVTKEIGAGFYQVTVTNSEGGGQFRLHVLFTDKVHVYFWRIGIEVREQLEPGPHHRWLGFVRCTPHRRCHRHFLAVEATKERALC